MASCILMCLIFVYEPAMSKQQTLRQEGLGTRLEQGYCIYNWTVNGASFGL